MVSSLGLNLDRIIPKDDSIKDTTIMKKEKKMVINIWCIGAAVVNELQTVPGWNLQFGLLNTEISFWIMLILTKYGL